MKQLKLSWLWLLSALLISTGAFVGCQKDAASPDLSSNAVAALSTTNGETCCVDDYENMEPVVLYSCSDETYGNLLITARNDASKIYVNILRTGDKNASKPNEFTRVTWVATQGDNVVSGNTEGSDNSPKTSYSFEIAREDGANLLSCARYSIAITIVGLEGYDALRLCLNEAPGAPSTQGRFDGIFTYVVKTVCNPNPPTCNGIRTQTLGYWGSSPVGTKYLANNWGTVGSITIGCETGEKRTFSTASLTTSAIRGNTGTPSKLPTLSTFSAQVITLSINLKFWPNTGSMIVTTGTFAGMTVNQVLALANDVIGGCNSTYTPSQLNDIVDAINKSFDNGVSNGSGIISCPM